MAHADSLSLENITVRQFDGLYSLNDLHKASGGSLIHRPNQFTRIDTTKALVAEIETAQICAVKTIEGRNGGTYVCRELVIAYAAWISAAFHLKVIRVFLASTAHQTPGRETLNVTLNRLADQLQTQNSYPVELFIPLWMGGANTDENMQLLRAVCNMQKSAKHPIDFMQSRGFLL